MIKNINKLFTPINIGQCKLKNRFVMEPMGPAGLTDSSGAFNERAIDFYKERAKGGVGLIIVGMCYVENQVEWHAPGTMPSPSMNPAIFKQTASRLVECVHAYGSKIFIQLSAGFGRVNNRLKENELPIAPSKIPYRWDPSITCRELTVEEIKYIVMEFGKAAKIAKDCGFDGVEVHAMHEGYLIDQFAMCCCNCRTDQYGGTLENRLRFAIEILQEVKKKCGKNYPVILRYSSKSFMKKFGEGALPDEKFIEFGRDLKEGLEIARILEKSGYDAFNADVGCYDSWYWNHPPMYFSAGMYLNFNKELKKIVHVPVISAGRMDNPDLAIQAVEDKETDLIGLARPLLADPEIVEKIRGNRLKEIRPCLSCQEACIGRLKKYMNISCAVNPMACHEKDYSLNKTTIPKHVAVIGGGIAGMEVARILQLRGHQPVIYEKSNFLGGKLRIAGIPSFKKDDLKLIEWYKLNMNKMNIPIHFNCNVENLKQLKQFDSVVLANGSDPKIIDIGNNIPVVSICDVLQNPNTFRAPILIIGGGMVGCESALMLAQMNIPVVIVEVLDELMKKNGPLCIANKQMLLDLLKFYKVPLYLESQVIESNESGITLLQKEKRKFIKGNTIALAIGFQADNKLFNLLYSSNKEVYVIGDARTGVGSVKQSIWDAFEIGSSL